MATKHIWKVSHTFLGQFSGWWGEIFTTKKLQKRVFLYPVLTAKVFFSRMSRKKPPKLALVKPIHKLWSPCLYGQLKKVCFHPNPRDWTIEVSSLETNKLDFSKSFSFSNSSLLSQDMTRWGWTRREGSNVMPFCRRQPSHTCFFFLGCKIFKIKTSYMSLCPY